MPLHRLPATLRPTPAPASVKIVAALVVGGIVFGDAATAAAVAAVGTLVNTIVIARLTRRVDDNHRELAAPRQIIHDDEGRPVASVIPRRAGDTRPDHRSTD